jgi:hypothetical protein
MTIIATTRFNNATWNENVAFREKYKFEGCIYGSPCQLSSKIDFDEIVFVIEMNNSTNKIEGIGAIKNKNRHDKYYRIYDAGNFNRYTFVGKYRICRNDLDPNLVELLDRVLFKGKTHSKRGDSITLFPEKILRQVFDEMDIKKEIKSVFNETYKNNIYQ